MNMLVLFSACSVLVKYGFVEDALIYRLATLVKHRLRLVQDALVLSRSCDMLIY